jgi:2,3-bisphosphoglycerate-independent phosphoglycerate mutase
MARKKSPLMLMILDGWGVASPSNTNAATLANTPNLDGLFEKYPHTLISCSGEDVGLPEGQMGNSEVGHMNIGSGRIVYQELTKITKSIKDGDFFKNEELLKVVHLVKNKNKTLHLFGLLSDGGVHSHIKHLFALLDMAKKEGLTKVIVHAFLDGRDVGPKSALTYINELEEKLENIGIGKIGSVSGRYYAMDRDQRWERIEKAYRAIALGEGEVFENAAEGIKASYEAGVNDEFVHPFVIRSSKEVMEGTKFKGVIKDDGIIFFNFRPDRARQITRSFVDDDFNHFPRNKASFPVHFVCMTQYDVTINASVAFKPINLKNTLGEVLANNGKRQLRIAETEKYAHVTFFFNGGVEAPNKLEDRILIPSPKVATYDLKPEMSAYEVTDKLLEALDKDIYDVVILNFANPDMVGHTGVISAAVKALEAVDKCVGKITTKILNLNGTVCVTADHGNLEKMVDLETGNPYTAHTTNKVPFIIVSNTKYELEAKGILANIAPTMLDLLKIKQPKEMTERSIIKN